MVRKKYYKYIIILAVLFIAIFPNFSKAAKVSVGQVKSVKSSSTTTTTTKVSWKKVKKVSGYRVYIYNDKTKKYEYYKQTTKTSMKITKLKSSNTHKIKIRAYKTVKGKKYYGKYSSILKVATLPDKTNNLKMKSQTDSTVKLSWSKVSRATGYRVYIYNTKTKKYTRAGDTKTNSITIKKLTSATKYKVKVRAYKELNNKKYWGAYSKVVTIVTKPGKAGNLKMTKNTLNTVTLTWTKVPRVEGYRIYKYNNNKKAWDYCGQTKNISKTISSLNFGTIYKFRVQGYVTLDGKRYLGTALDLDASTIPEKVDNLRLTKQTTSSITVKWDKLNSNTKYAVYIYSEYSKKYKIYGITNNNSIEIKNLETAKFYKIYVKGYTELNGTKYYGEKSNIISQRTLSTAKIKAGIDVSQHNGEIDWNEVKGKVDFAILRLGWIGNKDNHTLDTQFERNYNECKRLGIPVGVYVYCYSNCTDTVKSGANWTLKQLEGKTLDLPVFIDMEDESIVDIGKDNLSNICIEFNKIIEKANFKPGIYANRNWFDNYLNEDLRTKYSCWIAHYNEKVNYKGQYYIWQYTSIGNINGISGDVDLDIIYY